MHLQAAFETTEPKLRENAIRLAGKFDQRTWKHLERTLRQRSRLVPVGALAAECLALERFELARQLHAKALRTEKPKPWHALRIGLKRFRYTVESLLPEHYASWSDNLKRLQDILGEIHDLDVLTAVVKKSDLHETEDSLRLLLGLVVPPGWTNEDWELLALAVRYHRGAEPRAKAGSFSKLSAEQQNSVRALAGVLRLARALRKCGVLSGSGFRAEKSADTIVLRVPGLPDDAGTAARLAAGKHLLEEYLRLPLIMKTAAKTEKVVTLAPQQVPEFSVLASD